MSSASILEIGVRLVTLLLLFCSGAPAQTFRAFDFPCSPDLMLSGSGLVEQYDYTRSSHRHMDVPGKPPTGERDLPIQTLVQYPAKTFAET